MKKKLLTIYITILLMILALCPATVNAANGKTYKNTQSFKNITYTLLCDYSSYYYHKPDKCTRVTTSTVWNWKKCPKIWQLNDIVAVGNGQGFTVRQYANCKKNNYCTPTNVANCTVTYYLGPHQSGDSSKAFAPRTEKMTVKIVKSGQGAYVKIPMQKKYKINGVKCNFYAKQGKIVVNWEKQGKISPASFSSNYGHSTIKPTPSVSISGTDFKFGATMQKGNNAYFSMKKNLK